MRQLVVFLALSGVFFGCGNPGEAPNGVGDLAVEVNIPPAYPALAGLHYEVTRGGVVVAAQDIVLKGMPAQTSALFVGLPGREGYTVTVEGASLDGEETCTATTMANVVSRKVTSVSLTLSCSPQAGMAHIMTSWDCPLILSVTAAPTTTSVGAKVQLRAEVSPSDAAVTSYRWSVSSGSVADPTAAQTTFICGQAGAASVKVTTSRGACRDNASVGVTCVGAAP